MGHAAAAAATERDQKIIRYSPTSVRSKSHYRWQLAVKIIQHLYERDSTPTADLETP